VVSVWWLPKKNPFSFGCFFPIATHSCWLEDSSVFTYKTTGVLHGKLSAANSSDSTWDIYWKKKNLKTKSTSKNKTESHEY
jgi:hypothetical protein